MMVAQALALLVAMCLVDDADVAGTYWMIGLPELSDTLGGSEEQHRELGWPAVEVRE